MKIMKVICLLVLMSVSSPSVLASPCDRDGWTALHADDGGGYLFYLFREIPDVYFAIPGKKMSFPDGIKESPQFIIDGILYQSLLVKPTEFMKLEKGVVDLDILKKHQTYEFDYMQDTDTAPEARRTRSARKRRGRGTAKFYLLPVAGCRSARAGRDATIFPDHRLSRRGGCP